jgi:PIN domain nuclease of toxin-antitoxin system
VKLLLDTHIWIWSALEPERIAARVRKTLTDPANELWLSPISVGEVVVLLRKGRLQLPKDLGAWVANTMTDLRLTEAPLTIEVAIAVASFNFPHGDPADHFLAATAKAFDLRLVTADERLLRVPGIDVLPNR